MGGILWLRDSSEGARESLGGAAVGHPDGTSPLAPQKWDPGPWVLLGTFFQSPDLKADGQQKKPPKEVSKPEDFPTFTSLGISTVQNKSTRVYQKYSDLEVSPQWFENWSRGSRRWCILESILIIFSYKFKTSGTAGHNAPEGSISAKMSGSDSLTLGEKGRLENV